jgi:hypothetical protein
MNTNPTATNSKSTLPHQHTSQTGRWARQSLLIKSTVVAASGIVVTGLGLVAPSNAPVPGDLDTLANGCSIAGVATATQWEYTANQLKNRWHLPSADDNFNADATISVLASALSDPKAGPNKDPISKKANNDAGKFVTISEGQTAEIDGYIAYVKPGGVESCNCKSQDPQYMDTHIYVSATPQHANQTDKKFCLIVEVTPRVRIEQVQMGHDWATSTLISTLKPGTHVRISGYLFDDQEHRPNSVADSPSNANLWRASCWELHPVTDIQIVDAAASGSATKTAVSGGVK